MTGQTISHYRILEKLGEGGMGVVYRAEDLKLKRVVAIKFLPKKLAIHGEERERFEQEAQAASSLNHPNICTIHEIDTAGEETFIVMEYVEGVTIREWIRKKSEQSEGYRKLGLKEIIDIATQIAEGLEKAHEKGIVHRDIKSENIMVTGDGLAKIMDFGLAKLRGTSKLTKTGSTVGTIAYMSPEQVEGIETDHRTDIFSFGVLLYEMLSGRLPFRAEHETAMMYEIINVEPPSLLDTRQGIESDLNRIVMKCLEKDRDIRYQSMKDVTVDLKRYKRDSAGKSIERKVGGPSQPSGVIPEGPPKKPVSRRLTVGAGILFSLIIIGAAIYFLIPKREQINSLAVLPFVNTGADPNVEYLCDGFTENLINTLSRLPGIKIMSRSSVFRFKGKDIDPQAAARELGVSAVLAGRITQRGDEIFISAELINARDNSHIWGDQYGRRLTDIIALQSQITQEISDQLRVTLTGDQRQQLTKHATDNPEAYQFYLKGRFYWNRRDREGFNKAIEYFNQAIERDPSYALAYSGLADVYAVMGVYFILTPKETAEKTRTAARKALALDQSLAEPHAALASIYDNYDRDWASAEEEYRRAIELNPNYATGHQWYGEFLSAMGRFEEGLTEIQKSQALDPLAPIHYASLGNALFPMHRYEEVILQQRKALEIEPGFPLAHALLSHAYFLTGKNEEALHEIEQAVALSDSSIEYVSLYGYFCGRTGRKHEAEQILKNILQLQQRQYVSPYLVGGIYIGLGERDSAFVWLSRAIDSHDYAMEYLKVDPVVDPIRDDPRFAELMRKEGLPQ